jgi:hypothetical protein
MSMLGLDPEPAPARREPVVPATKAEQVLILGGIIGFILWLPVWFLWLRGPFNAWSGQYVDRYLVWVPLIGFPAAVGLLVEAIYSRRLLRALAIVVGAISVVAVLAVPSAMSRSAAVRAEVATPQWSHQLVLSGGRDFVTDGGIVYNTRLLKNPQLPTERIDGARVERLLEAPLREGYPLDALSPSGEKYLVGPDQAVYRARDVEFLRATLPGSSHIRLHATLRSEPVVITYKRAPVGLLFPEKVDARQWAGQ